MPYVSKDDIMAYIPTGVSLSQSVATQIEIILYKDYIDNQLNIANADAVTVTLYNSKGQKTYQYSNPVITGQTNRLQLGQPATTTQGYITFDVTAQQAASMAAGDVFAQVTITYSNYYPRAKTYVLPQLLIGDNNDSLIPGGGTGSGTGDNVSVSIKSSTPTIKYNVGSINGAVPSIGGVSFNNEIPSAVTEITFYNLDANNMRNTLLENYLLTKLDNGVSGTITIVDINDSRQYAIYNISSYVRINPDTGGGDDNDNDSIKITVVHESSSYTPIAPAHKFIAGQSISYDINTYGGASVINIEQEIGISVSVDKNQNVIATTTHDHFVTGIDMDYTPFADSDVIVKINGIEINIGDGVNTSDCYFTDPTWAWYNTEGDQMIAKPIADIEAGDILIWNPSIAGYQLEPSDDIDIIYQASSYDLN